MNKTIAATALSAVALLLLSGCASSSSPAASDTAQPSTPTPTASASTPAIDDLAACGLVGDRLLDTQTVVEQIVADGSGATLDWSLVDSVATDLHSADDLASPTMQGYLAPFASVVFTLEAIRAGTLSGSQNLDTGAYRDSVGPLLGYCSDDVGYSAAS